MNEKPLTIKENFQEWFKEHFAPYEQGDDFSMDDMQQAFEEGYHVAKDQVLDILEYWANLTAEQQAQQPKPEPPKAA